MLPQPSLSAHLLNASDLLPKGREGGRGRGKGRDE